MERGTPHKKDKYLGGQDKHCDCLSSTEKKGNCNMLSHSTRARQRHAEHENERFKTSQGDALSDSGPVKSLLKDNEVA